MSKPVKNLITAHYKKIFAEVDGAVLIDIRGIKSNETNKLRTGLSKHGIKVTVVKNSLARRAFDGTKMSGISPLLQGPSAMVFGGDSVVSVARELIAQVKEIPTIAFKGALMDGSLFQADQIEALSKYPTRQEAQAKVVQLLLSPAKSLTASILGPGRKIASLVKAIQTKLEKGEPIAAKA